jgi:hypothetical protein
MIVISGYPTSPAPGDSPPPAKNEARRARHLAQRISRCADLQRFVTGDARRRDGFRSGISYRRPSNYRRVAWNCVASRGTRKIIGAGRCAVAGRRGDRRRDRLSVVVGICSPTHHFRAFDCVRWLAAARDSDFGVQREGERPRAAFLLFSCVGSALVVGYAVGQGISASPTGDMLMLAASSFAVWVMRKARSCHASWVAGRSSAGHSCCHCP